MQLSAGQDAIVSFNHHNLNVFASASSNEAYVTMTTLSPGIASRCRAVQAYYAGASGRLDDNGCEARSGLTL